MKCHLPLQTRQLVAQPIAGFNPDLYGVLVSNLDYSLAVDCSKASAQTALIALRALPDALHMGQKKSYLFYGREAGNNTLDDSDSPLAFIDFLLSYPRPKTVFIGLLMVSAAEQGQGLASWVLKQLRNKWQDQGYNTLNLAVVERNRRALNFGVKQGFRVKSRKFSSQYSCAILILEQRLPALS